MNMICGEYGNKDTGCPIIIVISHTFKKVKKYIHS
jgi:hypothetical protein